MEMNGNKSASTLNYQWSDNGNILNSEKGSVLNISNAQRGHLYRCLVSSSKTRCMASLAYSDSIDFNATVKGLDNLSIRLSWDTMYAEPIRSTGVYSWYCNGVKVGAGTTHKVVKNGNYRCVFEEIGCSSDSSNLIKFNSLNLNQPTRESRIIKPNPSNGHSYIMLSSNVVRLQILELATGRLIREIEVNERHREMEYALELDSKGTYSVQQLDSFGHIISQDIWVIQ
ncbi:MAG: hypothetical protein RL577_685 [Bacteroidota bacterium]